MKNEFQLQKWLNVDWAFGIHFFILVARTVFPRNSCSYSVIIRKTSNYQKICIKPSHQEGGSRDSIRLYYETHSRVLKLLSMDRKGSAALILTFLLLSLPTAWHQIWLGSVFTDLRLKTSMLTPLWLSQLPILRKKEGERGVQLPNHV